MADGTTCAANASLISTRSMSSIVRPARAERLPARLDRAEAHDLGVERRHAAGDDARERRDAELPRRWASLITTTAAAPSLSGHALPAVTVPSGRNTGLSCDELLDRGAGRGPSSLVTTVPSGVVTGVISRSKKPFSCDATARCCESAANSSISSRVTFSYSATFSAVWPIAM